MTQAEQRANELYPNDRAFCGGVASIARDAYLKGCQETRDAFVADIKQRIKDNTFGAKMELMDLLSTWDK